MPPSIIFQIRPEMFLFIVRTMDYTDSMTISDSQTIEKTAAQVVQAVQNVFLGKDDVIKMLLTAVFAGGHVLLEDVPGTGKTVLAKTLAKSLDLPFARIQCTPDLMPSDITGSSVWSPKTGEFSFRAGPVLTNLLLVDELNRATPRTQSALLEAMAESNVSVDGENHPISEPFFVIATENPVESEGTFPLPEAQKDRFMLSLSIGYPELQTEKAIILADRSSHATFTGLSPVLNAESIMECRRYCANIHADESVLDYLLAIVSATRNDTRIKTGISPRGSIALFKASQAFAAISGRSYITPEDVKTLCLPVFRKRLILSGEALLRGHTADSVTQELLAMIPVPAFKPHK